MEYVEVLKDVEVLKYQLVGLFDTLQQAETKNHDIDHTMNKLKDPFTQFITKIFMLFDIIFQKLIINRCVNHWKDRKRTTSVRKQET